jgi:ribonuclease BN (tRNA processing enzyme)
MVRAGLGATERERLTMRLTIIGSGDAFGSGGRFNTCFMVEAVERRVLVDFGASSLVALRGMGIDPNDLDGVILSHLHGDHFGALPFFLIDAQMSSRRQRPFVIAGPPGTRARLDAALEVFFPRSSTNRWRFGLDIIEIVPGEPYKMLGLDVRTTEVIHPSGAPSTAIRVTDGERVLAYSGDTEWTDALLTVADGADLFVVECFDHSRPVPGHLCWTMLEQRLPEFRARRVMLTHMNSSMLARLKDVCASGVLVASDRAVLEV